MNGEAHKKEANKENPSRKVYGIIERKDEEGLEQDLQKVEKRKVKRPFKQWVAGLAVASLCLGVGIGGSLAFIVPYSMQSFYKARQGQSKMGQQQVHNVLEGAIDVEGKRKIEPYENGIMPPELDGSIVSIAKNIGPCVVSIYSNKKINFGDMGIIYSDLPTEGMVTGLGSGVIFDEDDENYYIITNNHVVDGADSLAVNFVGDIKAEAKIVGKDDVNDIAVVRVEKIRLTDSMMETLAIAPLGDSDRLEVGQLAVAIGTPATDALSNTVTTGIISGIAREITLSGHKMNLIQTSAAINSGNSGGALVGPTGTVIGINVAKTVDTEGIGFAIPINQVKTVVTELMANGSIERPALGITGIEVTASQSATYELPIGIYIQSVMIGGSADLAGIKSGDILIQFDGITITTMDQLKALIAEKRVGDLVEVKAIRQGEARMFKLELKEMPES